MPSMCFSSFSSLSATKGRMLLLVEVVAWADFTVETGFFDDDCLRFGSPDICGLVLEARETASQKGTT